MSSQKKYLSFRSIQERMKSYHEQTGQYITLSQAVELLDQEGRVLSAPLPCVDFSKWDTANMHQLYDLSAQTSVEISSILRDPEAYYRFVSEEYMGFSFWDVLPHIKMCYEAITPHTHDFFEINYVLDGSLEMECAAEKKLLGAGELCIIAPGTNHAVYVSPGSTVTCLCLRRSSFRSTFFSTLKGNDLLAAFFNNCLYSGIQGYLLFMLPPTPEVCNIIKNVYTEYYGGLKNANAICCSYTSIFFSLVLRLYSKTYLQYSSDDSIMSQMPAILTYIQSNFKTVTLSYLAEFFHYEKAYLGKQIKLATGMYFTEIISQQKINLAVQYLIYSDRSVNDIAELVGYNSPDHFSRAFKHSTGLSPTQYRKQHQGTFLDDETP
ncbi:MAG: AraC family transcriptional regulator [Clostridiales bacterium]|nr:AraC family transcriptional regulator [Clostridiales bacterium]